MPIRYLNPLPNPIQRGINVEFFDRKAMEKQQRHDKARALYSQQTQDIANQSYTDEASRQQFLKERESSFQNVINANAGNLSKGFSDILGTIEQSALHPYNNLNKRSVEQNKIQQAYKTKYGERYLNKSTGLDQPLYSEGNWVNPGDIQSGALEASDYYTKAKDILSNLKAKVTSGELDLANSPNRYYLEQIIFSNKTLKEEDIRALASDPALQQTFLASTTANQDDRIYNKATGETYQQAFSDKDKLADFITGANLKQIQNESIQKTKYLTNHAAILADKKALSRLKQKNSEKLIRLQKENYILKPSTKIITGTDVLSLRQISDLKENYDETLAAKNQVAQTERNIITNMSESYGFDMKDKNWLKTAPYLNLTTGKVDPIKAESYLRNQFKNDTDDQIQTKKEQLLVDHANLIQSKNMQLSLDNDLESQDRIINVFNNEIDDILIPEFIKKLDGTGFLQGSVNKKTKDVVIKFFGEGTDDLATALKNLKGKSVNEVSNLVGNNVFEPGMVLLSKLHSSLLKERSNIVESSKKELSIKTSGWYNVDKNSALKRYSDDRTEILNTQPTASITNLQDPYTGTSMISNPKITAMMEDKKVGTEIEFKKVYFQTNDMKYTKSFANDYIIEYTDKNDETKQMSIVAIDPNSQESQKNAAYEMISNAYARTNVGDKDREKDIGLGLLASLEYRSDISEIQSDLNNNKPTTFTYTSYRKGEVLGNDGKNHDVLYKESTTIPITPLEGGYVIAEKVTNQTLDDVSKYLFALAKGGIESNAILMNQLKARTTKLEKSQGVYFP